MRATTWTLTTATIAGSEVAAVTVDVTASDPSGTGSDGGGGAPSTGPRRSPRSGDGYDEDGDGGAGGDGADGGPGG